MNGGSLIRATRKPLMKPISAPTAKPQRIEIGAGMP